MDNSPLRYKDETDRAYGLTGMTISMMVWDGEEMLAGVNLDAPAGDGLEVTPDFHFAGNPRLSARLAWQQLVKQFELNTAMLLGNAACRARVGAGRQISAQANSLMRAMVRDEGKSLCSLDDDEIGHVYDKTMRYLDQIFSHDAVAGIARRFAADLQRMRRLSAAEALERLSALNRL